MDQLRAHVAKTNDLLSSVRATGGSRFISSQRAMASAMKLQLRSMDPQMMMADSAEILLLLNDSEFDSAVKDELCDLVRVTDDVLVGNRQQKVYGLNNYTSGHRQGTPRHLSVRAAALAGSFVRERL